MTSKKSNATRKKLIEWFSPYDNKRQLAALDTHEREMQAETLDEAQKRLDKLMRGAYDSRDWDAACDTMKRNLREMAAAKRAGR